MLSQILPHVVIDCNAGLTPFQGMLSLTTMLALPTCQGMKLTENTILVTGISRGRPEAFHALGNKVVIAGRRQEVLDQTTDADPGIASVTNKRPG
jgi:phage tail protein X